MKYWLHSSDIVGVIPGIPLVSRLVAELSVDTVE